MADPEESDGASARPEQARASITVQLGVSTILLVLALVVAAYLLFRLPNFWLIALSAIVLATAVDKPVTAMQARGVPRSLGILLIYLVILALMAAAVVALAPIVTGDARALQEQLPDYSDRLGRLARQLPLGESVGVSLAAVQEAVREHLSTISRDVTDVGLQIGRTAFYIFVTLVVAFFLAAEPGVILDQAERYVPARHRARVLRIGRHIHERIGAWARGQLMIAVIFGTLMGVGLRLLGVPYAWSLGVVAGILEIIPYIGGAITVVLAVFSAATVGLPQIAGVIILYIVLVNLESHVLAPVLYGRALGLPPVAILLALLAGVELLGILGALLAVPLTVIVWAIAEEFTPPRGSEPPSVMPQAPGSPDDS
jgi:predicted PurR-regulated permease PerM